MRTKLKWLLAIVLSAVPAAAIADEIRQVHLPGINCKLYDPQQGDTFLDPGGLSVNGLRNNSSSTKYVACPIPRGADPAFSTSYTDAAGAYLSVSTGNAQLYMRMADNSSWSSYSATGINQVGTSWVYVITATPSQNGKSMSMYVTLPAGSYIGSYIHTTRMY